MWPDYEFVAHMGSSVESSGNGTITATGSPPSATGKIGDSTDFLNTAAGTSVDYMDTSYDVIPTGSDAAFTFQTWMKYTATAYGGIWDKSSGVNTQRFFVLTNYDGASNVPGTIGFFTRDSSVGTKYVSGSPSLNNGSWQSVAFTRTGSTSVIYVNGSAASMAGTTVGGSVHKSSEKHKIGGLKGNTLAYDGGLDEMRVRQSVLSANWITTEYNNQNANGSFWEATDAGGGGGAAQAARRGAVMMM